MSDGMGVPLTEAGLLKVKNCIEHCLTHYMTKKEAADTIFKEKKIDPRLTEIVWQQIEKENQEFFKEYYKWLALKEQFVRFSILLEQPAALTGHPVASKDPSNDPSSVSDNRPIIPSVLAKMSDKVGRPLTKEEIQKVQSCLKNCMTKRMDKKEAAAALLLEQNIEPRLTELVWEMLEEKHPEVFKKYYKRLAKKEQLVRLNALLLQQAALMGNPGSSSDSSNDPSNDASGDVSDDSSMDTSTASNTGPSNC